MFKEGFRKRAQESLRYAIEEYESSCKYLQNAAESLYQTRVTRGRLVIQLCENYINTLKKSPIELIQAVERLKFQIKEITGTDLELTNVDPSITAGSTAGAGVMAGVGVASFGPTAAMAFATTFGTASTGTAISALSGAAATNAALAWLGGGAVVAGGGGMAAGNALLALAGPIGWTIGGVAVVGSGLWLNEENKKIGREAYKRAMEIEEWTTKVNTAKTEVGLIEEQTVKLANLIHSELENIKQNAPHDYQNFNPYLKQQLATVINSINSLSQSLQKTVDIKW
ncbi:hypothetical protein [Scytonema sp. UIC 10036]|uniref:hypothetical protein n=1 Tax=Scytonema sp. UIC 10036 TaxID=2304196 RepID=UPI001A9BAAD5|nr:hypothetical protein [Scytonema sp. UIC 10036]